MASLGKLYFSPASPYVRKVSIVAKEGGFFDRLQLEPVAVAPTAKDTPVDSSNPLAKIPAIVLPDGSSLFSSQVICEYLDQFVTSRPKFFPAGDARWRALRLQALGDGILDAALLARYEGFLRPEDKRWAEWSEGQLRKVKNGIAALEGEVDKLPTDPKQWTIGEVSVISAVGYLGFRFPDLEIPAKLKAWYAAACEVPSVKETIPK